MLDSRQLPDWQGRPCEALGHALFREWLLVYEIIVECIWVLSGGASRLHRMHLKGGTQLTSTFTLTREKTRWIKPCLLARRCRSRASIFVAERFVFRGAPKGAVERLRTLLASA